MKVFISWSGERSEAVAQILKKRIPCVIQNVIPYFSSADIDKGARWSTDIAKELQDASFGILCVTKDNLKSEWLNFEAGALSKSIDQSRVCPFLIDLKPADIKDSPILQFQMASANKEEVKKLFSSINCSLDDKSLDEALFDTTFDTFWPAIEKELRNVDVIGAEVSEQQPIEEILELVRDQHKLLMNPARLLPPEYVSDLFRRSSSALSHDTASSIREIALAIHRLATNAEPPNEIMFEVRELSSKICAMIEREKMSRRFK